MSSPAPKNSCHHFWKFGRCKHGDDCKYQHIKSNSSRNNNNSNKPRHVQEAKEVNPIPPFRVMMKKKNFKHQHDMRRFVLSALSEIDIDDVVILMGKDSGIKLLKEILQFEQNIDAGNKKHIASFQRVIVPLLKLITERLHKSTNVTIIKKILGCIFAEVHFFKRVLKCLREIKERGDLVDRDRSYQMQQPEKCIYNPKDISKDVYLPIVSLHLLIITRVTDAVVDDDMVKYNQELNEILANERDTNVQDILKRANSVFESVRKASQDIQTSHQHERELKDLQLAYELQMNVKIPLEEQPGPGVARLDGPRHSNDFVNYRNITILPAVDEVMCEIQPYIPLHGQPICHTSDAMDQYLDSQFRLLREDMLASVRRGVAGFLKANALKDMKDNQFRYKYVPKQLQGNSVSLLVFRNSVVTKITPEWNRGIAFEIEFDQVVENGTSKKKRRDYWENSYGSRHLQYESMVCLALNINKTDGSFTDLVFALVCDRDIEALQTQDRCKIIVKALQLRDIDKLIEAMKYKKPADVAVESVLISVRGSTYSSYGAVLETLQQHNVETLSFSDVLISSQTDAIMKVPLYINNNSTTYDLSCILKDPNGTFEVLIDEYINVRECLKRRANDIILDDTQIDAFALCLTRRVALIQGPPGTGKSYVGVHVVRALLANSHGVETDHWNLMDDDDDIGDDIGDDLLNFLKLEPIVCICYTNHALDQFLEDLVEQGLDIDDVVRVGGRSKSEMLDSRNLKKLTYGRIPRDQYLAKKEAKNEADMLAKQIEDQCKILNNSSTSALDNEVIAQIKYLYDEHYYALFDDDFEVAGGKIARIRMWLNSDIETNSIDRSVDELLDSPQEIWEFTITERKKLWNYWKDVVVKDSLEELHLSIEKYKSLRQHIIEIDNAAKLKILKKAKIVGFTTSGCARYQSLLKALNAKVVICEEAGEVLESHIISSITSSVQQLIFIGDHLQLRPKVAEYSLSMESNRGYNLNLSLFERLVNKFNNSSNLSLCTLQTQRRMRPIISDLIRRTLYENLSDGTNVTIYPNLQGFERNLWFFDHPHEESSNIESSYTNKFEAEMIVELVRYSIRQGYINEKLTVLTPYVGQLLLLRKLFAKTNMLIAIGEADLDEIENKYDEEDEEQNEIIISQTQLTKTSIKSQVRLATVDNFQGEESDFIIISTVRNNRSGRTGFLKHANRVNVMLSRARHGMIILGSRSTVRKSKKAQMFNKILDILEEEKCIGDSIPLVCKQHGKRTDVKTPQDMIQYVADGGCDLPCGKRAQCGHRCNRNCHPDDPQHKFLRCLEACSKLLDCGHLCHKNCYEKCGPCNELISKKIKKCGHEQQIKCCDKDNEILCETIVHDVTMPLCDHVISLPCGKYYQLLENDNSNIARKNVIFCCTEKCNKTHQNCGHKCEAKCGDCTFNTCKTSNDFVNINTVDSISHVQCKHPCERQLFCGHQCTDGTVCHSANECPPCIKECCIKCSHSKCGRECKDICPLCSESCTWRCTVNHVDGTKLCSLPCSSSCQRLPCDYRCTKKLKCGHQCYSVCGEICPNSDYCKSCSKSRKNYPKNNHMIDFIEMKTFEDYDPVKDEPLIVLPCNHAFTLSTCDSHLRMSDYYEYDEKEEKYVGLKEIGNEHHVRPACPLCRQPIHNINRYGRMLNRIDIEQVKRKFYAAQMSIVSQFTDKINEFERIVHEEKKASQKNENLMGKCIKDIEKAIKKCQKDHPMNKLYEKELVYAKRNNLTHPKYVKPSGQIEVRLLLSNMKMERIRLMSLCKFGYKSKSRNNKNKFTNLERVEKKYKALKQLINKTKTICASSNLNRLITETIRESVNIHFTLLNFVEEVDLSDSNESIMKRELQKEAIDLLKVDLSHSDANDHIEIRTLLPSYERKLSGEPFYQDVTKEEKRMIFEAMKSDVGSGVGSFGGHWYTCSNGHTYTIGECGGAMQQSQCPECKETIGGSHHRLEDNNRVATEFLEDVKGPMPNDQWQDDAERYNLYI